MYIIRLYGSNYAAHAIFCARWYGAGPLASPTITIRCSVKHKQLSVTSTVYCGRSSPEDCEDDIMFCRLVNRLYLTGQFKDCGNDIIGLFFKSNGLYINPRNFRRTKRAAFFMCANAAAPISVFYAHR